jgi:hypothetical protein
MKSLIKGLVCMSLLAFAVGCGKDDSSGGGSSSRSYLDKNAYNALPQSSKTAWNNLAAWYNNKVEGTQTQGSLIRKQKYEITSTSNQPNCVEKKFLGIPYTYCTSSSGPSNAGTLVSDVQIDLRSYYGQVINRKQNTELNNLFNGKAGKLLGASQSGKVYRVDFLVNNSIVSYTIDANHHSLLNPVQKMVQSQTEVKQTSVYAYRIY